MSSAVKRDIATTLNHSFTSPVAQQGKGPSPIVVERFQSVASQLMSQVRRYAMTKNFKQ